MQTTSDPLVHVLVEIN